MTTVVPAGVFTATAAGARHATYAALAASGPVHHIALPDGTPGWLVTGRDEIRALLTDPRFVKTPARGGGPAGGALPADVDAAINTDLLHLDPPDHTRLRRLVSAAFTRRRVEQLAPRVQQITDELLDDLAGRREADLVATFAYPLPMTVICWTRGASCSTRRPVNAADTRRRSRV